jgi:LytR cell envelope-related transcriptional attenuator
MNAARIRAIAIVGVLAIAAGVLTKVAISDDKQSRTNFTAKCAPHLVPVVTDPLPDYNQITLKIYNGSKVPGQAKNLAAEFSHRNFKVEDVGAHDDKPTISDVADLYYGPKTLAAAWVVRSEFLLSNPNVNQGMYFNIKNTSNVVVVVIGTGFKELGAKTEVNQSIAALKLPSAPPGTCADNP